MLIAVVCLLTGLFLCVQARKRVYALEQFVRLFTVMQTQIAYAMQPTDVLLKSLCQTAEFSDFSFVHILYDVFQDGNSFSLAWREALRQYTAHSALKATDVTLLKVFADGYGTTDKVGQIENCAYHISRLLSLVSELKSNAKNAEKLYLSFGALGGLFISILLL